MSRRWLAPEVVQTSAMDCGPAALKCLLAGFGVHVAYGRLREACHTDVDGTSIDALEDLARDLGLDAAQVLVPADHVLRPEANALPAIAVVLLPGGNTHFVVLYRRHGKYVQIMDPGRGRVWVRGDQLLRELYRHEAEVPASAFLEYARSPEMREPLQARMAELGFGGAEAAAAVDRALAADGPWAFAALDAAVRMGTTLAGGGGLSRGTATARLVTTLAERALADRELLPERLWTVRPAPAPDVDDTQEGEAGGGGEDEPTVIMRGAVMVTARSLLKDAGEATRRSENLARALAEPPVRPFRELWRLLRSEGALAPAMLIVATAIAALGTVAEALLLRGLLDVGELFPLREQRIAGVALVISLVATIVGLEIPRGALVLALGRRLEARLRVALQAKVPRLPDRFFQSRLTSDMAQRGHSIAAAHRLPRYGESFLASILALIATVIGITWLDPRGAPLAMLAAVVSVALPMSLVPMLGERDMRVQTHLGALAAYYLDALLGQTALRAHAAERPLRREHDSLLLEWTRAARSTLRAAVGIEAVIAAVGASMAVLLVLDYLSRGAPVGGTLLVSYWALSLPVLGEQVAIGARGYPRIRNTVLRLLEPLDAPEDPVPDVPATAASGAVSLALRGVEVRAGGHTVLRDLTLDVPAGQHVAIVGESGAGKSSLVGLFLGFHRPTRGTVEVDGKLLDPEGLSELRRHVAWIDPAVQLWNRSLLANLRYGAADPTAPPGDVLARAELLGVLERLPEGLGTLLGEGGGLLSGGEGQRVRAGRAFARGAVRLALLDEPFRGLDRGTRTSLTSTARELFSGATMLVVSHDVRETAGFDRVLVVEDGRVIEDGAPADLLAAEGTRYRALYEADDVRSRKLWGNPIFRQVQMSRGQLDEVLP